MNNRLRETFKIVREPEYRIYWAIVAICGFVFALGLSLVLRRYFHFEFHNNSGIVGWVSVNKYPKQQEMFYYIAVFVFVPLFTAFCWFLWVAYSSAIALLIQKPARRILKQSAFSYIPLLLTLKDWFRPEVSVGQLLWMPVGLVIIAKLVLLSYNFFRVKQPINEEQAHKEGELALPKYINSKSRTLSYRLLLDSAGIVLAAGLCIGFYALIVYPPDSPTWGDSLKVLLITTFGALVFWCIYSLIISRIRHRRFQDAIADDAYTYVPAVLLLAISLFYPAEQLSLPMFSVFGFIGMKVLALLAPKILDELNAKKLAGRLLSYLLIPALFYVLLYGKGNVHWGLDLFHEGERLAPLNELLHGGISFRDIYIQHGLFQNAYRPLLASKLFGDTLASVRFLEGLFAPLGYVCAYLLGLQVFKSRLTAILLVFIVSGENFWISDRHSLFLINIILVANYITTRNDRGLFAGWRPIAPPPLCSPRETVRPEPFDKLKGRLREGTTAPRYRDKLRPTPSAYGREIFASCLVFGWKLILAGIVTSLAFFYSTEVGVYAFITCGLFLFLFGLTQKSISGIKRPLPLLCYLAGVSLGALPFILYFGWHNALDDLMRNSYIQLAYQIPTWGLPFPPLSSFLAQFNNAGLKSFTTETFRWYLPVLLYLIAATYLFHRLLQGAFWRSESNVKLLLLLLAGIALFRTALGRSDSPHLVYGSTMMWFIWLFFLERGISWVLNRQSERKHQIPKIIMKSVCILIPLAIFLWYISAVHHPVKVAKERLTSLTQYQSIPRDVPEILEGAGSIQLPKEQVSQVQQVVKYIQSNTNKNDTIFDFSSQGAYYFFTNRKSATRYHQIAYAATKNMQEEVIRDLEKSQTKLVIFKTSGWFDNIDGVTSSDRHPLIAKYLEENYQEAVNINGTIILRRGRPK